MNSTVRNKKNYLYKYNKNMYKKKNQKINYCIVK